jgi:hypothetical protein
VTASEPATEERAFASNMPQMALRDLSKSWLFKEIGDIHFQDYARPPRPGTALSGGPPPMTGSSTRPWCDGIEPLRRGGCVSTGHLYFARHGQGRPMTDVRLPQKGQHERYQESTALPEVPEADDAGVPDPKGGGPTGTKNL